MRGAEARDLKLSFLDLMKEFDAGNRGGRMIKALEPQHRPHSLFHATVVLFNHVVQIAIRSHKECGGQAALFLEFAYRYMRGRIPIKCDLLGNASLLDRLRQEPLGRSNITVFT